MPDYYSCGFPIDYKVANSSRESF